MTSLAASDAAADGRLVDAVEDDWQREAGPGAAARPVGGSVAAVHSVVFGEHRLVRAAH